MSIISESRRVVAHLKPPISLAQLPQFLAWHELKCAPSVTGLAMLDSEEPCAKHTFRLDSLNADFLKLAEDLLNNFGVDESVLGNDILDQGRMRSTTFFRGCCWNLTFWATTVPLRRSIRIRRALGLELPIWWLFGR